MEVRNPERGDGINSTSFTPYTPSSSSPSPPPKLSSSTPPPQFTFLPPPPTLDPPPHHHKFPTPINPNPEMIRYRECQRNHAAHLGGHVVDGCGEFMPAGDDHSALALKCAACDCHRNFHRREVEGATAAPPPLPPPTAANCYISFHSPKPQKHPALPPQSAHHQRPPPVMMTFGGGAAAESSSDDLNMAAAAASGQLMEQYGVVSRKRFRTRFTQEQKEKMTEFAEKIGWKIQRQDESEVQRFCAEAGVKRQVFKVWLHNNKQAMKRKPASSS